MSSPHWLLLLLLVPFTGPLLKGAFYAWVRIQSKLDYWKLVRIATDTGVDLVTLVHKDTATDALVLIQEKIAEECQLLAWRAIRLAQRAARDGITEATLVAENLERFRQSNLQSATGVMFAGFLIPSDSPLVRYRPDEVRAFNGRMQTLQRHWEWTADFLWHARKAEMQNAPS